MKTLMKTGFILTLLMGFSAVPTFAQDSLEDKINSLVDKIDEKIQDIEDDLSSKLSEFDENTDEDFQKKTTDLQQKMSELQQKLEDIQREDNSRQKERELSRLNDDLSDLQKEIDKNSKKAKSRASTIRNKSSNKYNSGKSEINRFSQTTTIEKEEKISGDVMVTNGDLIVFGEIMGDAVAVSGDVVVKNGAKISGDAVSTGGKVIKEEGATITGKTLETKGDVEEMNAGVKRPRRPSYPSRRIDSGENFDWSERWISNDYVDGKNFQVRYNRVEGLYLGGGRLKDFYWDGDKSFSLYGFLGYAFSSKDLQFQVGYDRWFGNEFRFEVGAEGHSRIQTYNDWTLSRNENSAAAFLIHEDYYDFFLEKGGSFHIATYLTPKFKAQAEIKADKQFSKSIQADWALFGGKKRFVENPVIDEGDIKAFVFSTAYDNVSDYDENPSGIYAAASAEITGGPLKGDYEYNLYNAEFRGFAHFTDYDDFRIRFKVSSAENNAPFQKLLNLGGVGTLNGYRVDRDTTAIYLGRRLNTGNRLMLVNAEYILTGRELKDELPSIFDDFCLLFFDDIGYIGNTAVNAKPWEGFNMSETSVKNSVGFGFTDEEGMKRLTFAWRTDKGNEPVQVMFRWTRPF